MNNPKSENRGPKETRSSKSETGQWNTRSVLECGGSPPLSAGGRLADQRKRRSSGAVQTLARTFTLLAFLLAGGALVLAQAYSIDWSTIDGGGGTSTGGVYAVSGTIGQPEAGPPAYAGGYSLQGGFWSVIAAVQTPDAPWLSVTRSNNAVIVSWPWPADGWVLQATNALPSVAAPWPQVPPPYQTNGANLQFTEPLPGGNKFYRLHKP